ncbi:MAG: tetratricopeptide repeat protein, partial [Aggregatilineales bacterium]
IEYYEQALAISRALNDRRNEGTLLGNLGIAYSDLGQVERAIEYYEQALAISRAINDRRSERTNLGNLGYALSRLGRHEEAIQRLREALRIAEEVRSPRSMSYSGTSLAQALAYAGRGEEALAVIRAAQAHEVAENQHAARCWHGVLALRQAAPDEARAAFQAAIAHASELLQHSSRNYQAYYVRGLARVGLSLLGEASALPLAREDYRRGRAICNAAGILEDERRALRYLLGERTTPSVAELLGD